MVYEHLIIENRKNGLRIIKFNNMKRKNAWNPQTYQDITDALNSAATDDAVSCLALTGVGDFYSSGNDMIAAMEARMSGKIDTEKIIENMVKSFYRFPKLLIAIINGPCIGIAATTAVLCDVVYMVEGAYIYTPFTLLGLCAEACASYTFPKILGKSKASEMLLLNHKMYADEALRFNFASELLTAEDVAADGGTIWTRLENFAKLPKGSVIVTKDLMKRFEINDLEKAWADELLALSKRIASEEAMEAVVQFMNRKSKL